MTTSPYPISAPKPSEAASLSGLRARAARFEPLAVLSGTALLLWWLFGHRLILATNDEGIYLDGAERILHGQKLYVDFFGYMSPLSYWVQALAFRVFGVTQAAGRAPVIAYLALECSLVYWLVARYASRACGLWTALVFLAFEIADPRMMTAQHRWDSGALAFASIAICIACQAAERRPWLTFSGFLIAAAALATPSVSLAGIATLGWLTISSSRRRAAIWYLLGMSIAALGAMAELSLDGTLAAFIQQMRWLSRNYSALNIMPFGSVIGGYHALFASASTWELPLRLCLVFCLALPAVLPLLALAGGALLLRRQINADLRSVLPYLLVAIVALVASTHPRSDVAHLAYIAALPYAVCAILAYRLVPSSGRVWLGLFLSIWAAVFAWQSLPLGAPALETPVGEVRASAGDALLVSDLLQKIQPGQSLFVYPYKPLLYFLTQAHNPTRFSYLQPGLMTASDAALALAQLEAHPPEWVLFMDLSQSEFERVFPSGKGFVSHFPPLESWIKTHYQPDGNLSLDGYALLRYIRPESR